MGGVLCGFCFSCLAWERGQRFWKDALEVMQETTRLIALTVQKRARLDRAHQQAPPSAPKKDTPSRADSARQLCLSWAGKNLAVSLVPSSFCMVAKAVV
jgi:hypothetical protein